MTQPKQSKIHIWPLVLAMVATLALVVSAKNGLPRVIVFNPSESAPRGLYRIEAIDKTTPLSDQDFVLIRLLGPVAAFSDQRQYLSKGLPLLKQIGALEGQAVCLRDGDIEIDGHRRVAVPPIDGQGRALKAWPGCRVLKTDELFLLSRHSAASFDSRYFGPIHRDQVIGRAHPLWLDDSL